MYVGMFSEMMIPNLVDLLQEFLCHQILIHKIRRKKFKLPEMVFLYLFFVLKEFIFIYSFSQIKQNPAVKKKIQTIYK